MLYKFNIFTGVFDLVQKVDEALTHGSLSDMPDVGGTNTDHDARYFTESEHIDTSSGAGDAGKPVKLNSEGLIDSTMVSVSPGGSDTQIQYNDGGAFAGSANLIWDDTNKILKVTGSTPELRVVDTDSNEYTHITKSNTVAYRYDRVMAAGVSPAWYDTSWDHRKKITVDSNEIDATLSNFTLLVKLTSSNFDFSEAKSDGTDIRFTSDDGATLLKFDRERHNNVSEVAEYNVKVTSISSASNTDIYIYYGNASASDAADAPNAYDGNTLAVYHMNDNASNTHVDEATETYDGTLQGGDNTDDLSVAGQIANALNLDGSADYVDCGTGLGDALGSGVTTLTISAVFKSDSSGANDGIVSIGSFAGAHSEADLHIYNDDIYFMVNSNGRSVARSFTDTSNWHHVVGVYDGSNIKIYLDYSSTHTNTYSTALDFTNLKTILGGYYSSSYTWDGQLDEIRISSTNRAAAWVKAEYKMFMDNANLLTFGSQENAPAASAGQITVWQTRNGILSGEDGIVELGDDDVRGTINGKTIRFNINSSEKMHLDADGYLGLNETSMGGMFHVTSSAAGTKGAIFEAATDATANLTEWWNDSHDVLLYVEPDGELVLNQNNKAFKLGSSQSASIKYNNNLIVKPDENGTGYVYLDSSQQLVLVIGNGTDGVDHEVQFKGTTNTGSLQWMEDEDYFRFNDDVMLADGENIVLDTTTGTKIGTATSQKLGFFGATPVVQQSHVADADGTLADITTKFNTTLAQIEALGLFANA